MRTWPGASSPRVPEREQVFQITQPDFGFGGLVLKPWGERKRTAFQIVPEVQAMVDDIPGIRMFMVTRRRRLPTGGENFPVNLILILHRRARTNFGICEAVTAKMRDQRHVRLSAPD